MALTLFGEYVLGVLVVCVVIMLGYWAVAPDHIAMALRNGQRQADVTRIAEVLYAYAADHGSFPPSIPQGESCALGSAELCRETGERCVHLVDVGDVSTYWSGVPFDPGVASPIRTGYFAVQLPSGRLEVCAPHAENGATIVHRK